MDRHECDRAVDSLWSFCPYCGHPLAECLDLRAAARLRASGMAWGPISKRFGFSSPEPIRNRLTRRFYADCRRRPHLLSPTRDFDRWLVTFGGEDDHDA